MGKGRLKSVSNYRKVKYSCALEEDAKFNCSEAKSKWKSDKYSLRFMVLALNDSRIPGFQFWAPYKNDMRIDPNDQTIAATEFNRNFVRLMLSPAVTKIGCFVKVCGEYEYIACKTGHVVVASKDTPLYTPGKRCTQNSDCTISGYTHCDADSGLCEKDLTKKAKVSPLTCFTKETVPMQLFKEKCDNVHDTGSDISQAERNKMLDTVNEYRTLINNNCTLGLGVVKPASNYRKVKYSCDLEMEAKFECGSYLTTPKHFQSDKQTWRRLVFKHPSDREAIFLRVRPFVYELMIDPDTQLLYNDDSIGVFARIFMSDDVTEMGCFVKECGFREYIACRSNHNRNLPIEFPLYTPGQRCNTDADCTLPGYHVCDASVGLCDYRSHLEIKKKLIASQCENRQHIFIKREAEKCSYHYDTGSDISVKEREVITDQINHYRQLINNNCDLGKGVVKPITNYRKVKYSCALEEDVKFKCFDVQLKEEEFVSDKYTLRLIRDNQKNGLRYASFLCETPWNHEMLIYPANQISAAGEKLRSILRFMLSPNVTEIGCFVKACDDREFTACKTGHVIVAPEEMPLYTPGNRCTTDEDCTLPGYGICDTISGMCEEP